MSGLAEKGNVKSNVFKIIKDRLDNSLLLKILNNFCPTSDNHTSEIVQPEGGEVYIFFKKDGPKDYVVDGYKWRNHSQYFYKEEDRICMRITYYKCSDNPEGADKSNAFRKRVVCLPNLETPVIVEYMGDEQIVRTPHGNNRDNKASYFRSTPSIIQNVTKQLNTMTSFDVYKNTPVANRPRNKRVLSNIKYVR